MGISQQIGSSSLSKPGVCTSSTRPATPYEGQMIYETDTDKVLVYNGTAWVIPNSPAQNPTGLELVTTATCSSGGTASGGVVTIGSAVSSVTVSSAFSTIYDNYEIILSGGVATGDANLRLTLGSTVTGYYASGIYVGYTAATIFGTNTNNGTFIDIGYGSTNALSGKGQIDSPFLAKRTVFRTTPVSTSTTYPMGVFGGYLNDATSYTAFTITASGGTMTGGTIRVYGYRNS